MRIYTAKSCHGFTLIELAISVLIVGLIFSGILTIAKNYFIEKNNAEISKDFKVITSALAVYIRDESRPSPPYVDPNAHFPCPAPPTLSPGQTGFGLEARTGANCDSTSLKVVGLSPNRIFIGAVPALTLGIDGGHMSDPYSNKYTYAVSESVSKSNSLKNGQNPLGSIVVRRIKDNGTLDSPIPNVQFVLIHHGKNGYGAYTTYGALKNCPAGTHESDNCNQATMNSTFIDGYGQVSEGGNSRDFDDSMVFSLRGIEDKEEFWGLGIDTTEIYSINSGNVGVGTADPTARLHVSGPPGVINLRVEGHVEATTYLHSSDRRLKENIEKLEDETLSKLLMLEVVRYNYLHSPENKKIGLIAQDLAGYYPELVHTDDKGNLSIDYIGLIGPIIKGFQENKNKNDDKINKLEDRIRFLEEYMEVMECRGLE